MLYILTLALILRLVLFNQSLWLDEAIQALALMGKMGPLSAYVLTDFQPPLYHFLGWLWTSLAGYSELALRTPSLLAGVGTVYFAARLGSFLGGKKLMYLAGLLTATNPLLIYYSQEGRTYALTTFFVTAAMYYFFKIQKDPHQKLYTVYYVLCTIAYLWSSYLAWSLHLVLFGYALYHKRRDLILPQLLAVATLIFWLPSLLSSLGIGLSTVSSSPEWGRVVGGISLKALALTWVKATIGRISLSPPLLYAATVCSLFALHARILLPLRRINPLLLVWLSPIVLNALFSLFLPVYSYTRLLFVVPSYLLLLAHGLMPLSRRYTLLILATQLTALVFFWVNPRFHREDWRSLVKDHGEDRVYALPSRSQSAPLLYYGVKDSSILEPKVNVSAQTDTILYLKYVEDVFDPKALGTTKLRESGYTLTREKVYPGLQLNYYENNH